MAPELSDLEPNIKSISYPKRLLPSDEKDDAKEFCSICSLVRRSIDENKMYDADDKLVDAAFQLKQIFTYSVNIVLCRTHDVIPLTPTYEGDVLIELEDPSITHLDWKRGDSVGDPEKVKCYVNLDKGYFILPISIIEGHEGTFPFQKGKNIKDYSYRWSISHKPNPINFYHFQFVCYSDVNSDDGSLKVVTGDNIKTGYRKEIVHSVKEHLRNNIKRPKSA